MAESEVERILAQYYGGAPDTLGGPAPPPRPTPGSGPQLGQHNALNRLLAMPGQPTADALQRGLEGNATPQEVAWEFLTNGPVGPLGMASRTLYRGRMRDDPRLQERPYFTDRPDVADLYAGAPNYPAGANVTRYRVQADKVLVLDRNDPAAWPTAMRSLGLPDTHLLTMDDIARIAGQRGYDLVEVRNMQDVGGRQSQYIATNRENVQPAIYGIAAPLTTSAILSQYYGDGSEPPPLP